MSLISVIVPIYNVETVLDKCVQSIVSQTYNNLEIILVDDGSPDNCHVICDDWAKKDNRIKVIHKQNGGLSSARNAGLDIATGQYIMFIDSDDYFELNAVELAYNRLIEDNSDLLVFSLKYVDEDNNVLDIPLAKSPIKNGIYTNIDILNKLHIDNGHFFIVAWNKIYKKETFKNLRFEDGKLHEDEFIIHKILEKCPKISCIENQLYNYVQRSGSITNTGFKIKNLDAIIAILARVDYMYKVKARNYIPQALWHCLVILSKGYYYLSLSDKHNKNALKSYKKQISKYVKKMLSGKYSVKLKVIMVFAVIFPKMFSNLLKLKGVI